MSLPAKLLFVGAIAGALTAILAFSTTASTIYDDKWYKPRYGLRPHASVAELKEAKELIIELAQNTIYDMTARQIGRQAEIERLSYKCNIGRCTQYDVAVLNNLRADWHREQQVIERLRQQHPQQHPPSVQQQPPWMQRR